MLRRKQGLELILEAGPMVGVKAGIAGGSLGGMLSCPAEAGSGSTRTTSQPRVHSVLVKSELQCEVFHTH